MRVVRVLKHLRDAKLALCSRDLNDRNAGVTDIEASAKIVVWNIKYRAQKQKPEPLMSKQSNSFLRWLLGNIAASLRVVTVAERQHKFVRLLAHTAHSRFKSGGFKRRMCVPLISETSYLGGG